MKKIITIVAISILAACAEKPVAKTPESVALAAKKTTSDQHQSPGKTHAAIEIDYRLSEVPAVGQPLEVSYHLRNTREEQDVTATLEFDGEVIATPQQHGFFKAAANTTKVVNITPDREGMHYIKVFSSSIVNGKTIHKAFNIPVQVGEVNWKQELKPEGELVEDSAGNKLIVLPAQ